MAISAKLSNCDLFLWNSLTKGSPDLALRPPCDSTASKRTCAVERELKLVSDVSGIGNVQTSAPNA